MSYSSGSLEEATSPDVPNMEREAIQAFCNAGGIVTISAMNGERATPDDPFIGVDIIRPGARIYPAALAQDLTG